jgi:outer membrane protein TolC
MAFKDRSSIQAQCTLIRRQHNLAWAELSGYFPQVQVIAAPWLRSKENLFDNNFTFVGIRQLLWSFSGPLDRYKIEKRNECIAQLTQDLEYDKVQLEARVSFLDVWLSHKKKAAISLLDASSRKEFERATNAYEVGLISTSSWLGFSAIKSEAQAAVQQYPHERNRFAFALDRAVEQKMYDSIDDYSAEEYMNAVLMQVSSHTLDYYTANARSNRKELLIKQQEIERECQLRKLYLRSYLPDISFFSFITNNGIIPVLTENLERVIPSQFRKFNTFWALGIAFGWQFDGLGNVFRASASKADVMAKELERKDLEQQINLEVQTAHEEMQELHEAFRAQQERLKSAQQDFELQSYQFKVGNLSQVDFETAQYRVEEERLKTDELKVRVSQKHEELMFKSGYPCQLTCKVIC